MFRVCTCLVYQARHILFQHPVPQEWRAAPLLASRATRMAGGLVYNYSSCHEDIGRLGCICNETSLCALALVYVSFVIILSSNLVYRARPNLSPRSWGRGEGWAPRPQFPLGERERGSSSIETSSNLALEHGQTEFAESAVC